MSLVRHTHEEYFVRSIDKIGELIVEVNKANGWNVSTPNSWREQYKIPAVIALIHSEVSEALEAYRADNQEEFLEELADVVIRVMDLTSGMGKDLGRAVLDKIEKNKTRGYRHGGKTV